MGLQARKETLPSLIIRSKLMTFTSFRCRKGFRYVGNTSCVVDECYEENRNGKLCGELECVVTNDSNEAVCR